MSILDGFHSIWSNAKAVFGDGPPQNGAQYDASATLTQLHDALGDAAPDENWSGAASDAYGKANTEHRRVIGELARLDKELGKHVDGSAAVVTAGRNELDTVRARVVDAASSIPRTTAGERMLLPIVSSGLSNITAIIERTHADLTTIGTKIRAISTEYTTLGDQKFGQPQGEIDPTSRSSRSI